MFDATIDQSNSHADIAFTWQFMYIFGLAASMPYTYSMKVYPVAIPITLELALCVVLTFVKFKFDVIDKKFSIDENQNICNGKHQTSKCKESVDDKSPLLKV